jgi:hypothetical protein
MLNFTVLYARFTPAYSVRWKTAHKRIETLGIKPLSYKALYDPSIVEKIRNVPGKNRPKKALEAPAKPAKKPAKK